MFSYIRALKIFIKRALCKPFTIILMLLIPLSAILFRILPEKEMTSTVETGIYIETADQYTEALTDILEEEQDGFIFVICDSKDELTDKVASGIFDCGFILPEDYTEIFINGNTSSKIAMYTSPASMFQYVSMEKLYSSMLKIYAPVMTSRFIESAYGDSYESYIKEHFNEYINNNSVFTINVTGSYKLSDSKQKLNSFPVYEVSGLLIFICGLFGVLQFLRDENKHAYDRLPAGKRFIYCGINIAANIIPAATISYITLIIYGYSANAFKLFIHISIYLFICLLYSLVYRLIFRKYVVYQAALPFIIALSLLLTPTFIDIAEYIPALKMLSMLFAPYFF
ncbi:MAG: hypothetical protein ACI4EF_04455 [Coprococcus sp.]